MQVLVKPGLLILAPQGDEDLETLAALKRFGAGHVFRLNGEGRGVALSDLGAEADACREPVNITSRATGELALISNFAATPFELDGVRYASVEGFWQGLKFPHEADRRRLAGLSGVKAKDAGGAAPAADVIRYADADVRVGTWEHWSLMARACEAKFEQHQRARRALLGTDERPLTHRTRPDSRTIPGAILAEIWMQLRGRLRDREG